MDVNTATTNSLYTNDIVHTPITTVQRNSVLLVLGDQLYNPGILANHIFMDQSSRPTIYISESVELCRHYRYHKHKLIHFLSCMRHYAVELQQLQWNVHYDRLDTIDDGNRCNMDLPYLEKLYSYCVKHNISTIYHYPISDLFFETPFFTWCTTHNIQHILIPSMTGYVTSRAQFSEYINSLGTNKKPFAASFYIKQRHRLNILIDSRTNKPFGGKYSYDTDNRKSLPKSVHVPDTIDMKSIQHDTITNDVIELINTRFSSHPGSSDTFYLATSRNDVKEWLNKFLVERLHSFGLYEDAITQRSPFVYHSVLSPYLNTGLITTHEIILTTLQYYQQNQSIIPLSSIEGFIRQLIGWREYINGLYHHYTISLTTSNYWQHHRTFKCNSFYNGTTGILPFDDCIRKVLKLGYLHHIERLMVCGNIFMLCEIQPNLVYQWYMELFIDSADWVMQPNVYGMILNVDGGACGFTKPYLCSSNYIIKQCGNEGTYSKSQSWCNILDGLYWRFLQKHRTVLSKNMRMGKILYGLDRMSDERKSMIFNAAELFLNQHTILSDQYQNIDQSQYYHTGTSPQHSMKVEPNTVIKSETSSNKRKYQV